MTCRVWTIACLGAGGARHLPDGGWGAAGACRYVRPRGPVRLSAALYGPVRPCTPCAAGHTDRRREAGFPAGAMGGGLRHTGTPPSPPPSRSYGRCGEGAAARPAGFGGSRRGTAGSGGGATEGGNSRRGRVRRWSPGRVGRPAPLTPVQRRRAEIGRARWPCRRSSRSARREGGTPRRADRLALQGCGGNLAKTLSAPPRRRRRPQGLLRDCSGTAGPLLGDCPAPSGGTGITGCSGTITVVASTAPDVWNPGQDRGDS